VTRVADRAAYADLAEAGLAAFDRKSAQFRSMQADWKPLLDALD